MRSYKVSLSKCVQMALLVVVMLVPALAMDPLGLNSPAGLTTPVSAQDGTDWSGKWRGTIKDNGTNAALGVMTLTQSGNQVTGSYSALGWRDVKGAVSGNKFTGTWSASNTLHVEMTLAPDGQSMTARYQFSGDKDWNSCSFTRIGAGTDTGTPTGTGVALVAESRTADPGSTVQVPIRLDRAVNIGSMDFTLTYNAQVLKVNTVDDGAQVSGVPYVANTEIIPQVIFAGATDNGISGSGSVIYIEFQVIGAAGTSSPLTLSEVDIKDTSGNKVTVSTTNGTVTVASATGPGGKLKGDYNGDGKVTELDALAALKMSAKSLKPVDLIVDMNDDGLVKAEDALAILKIAVGK